ERPYRLDRMWTHLELAGVFSRVRGIALGSFTGCEEKDASYTSDEVLGDLARATGLPCAGGFPVGHGEVNEPLPLGPRVRLHSGDRGEHLAAAAADLIAEKPAHHGTVSGAEQTVLVLHRLGVGHLLIVAFLPRCAHCPAHGLDAHYLGSA